MPHDPATNVKADHVAIGISIPTVLSLTLSLLWAVARWRASCSTPEQWPVLICKLLHFVGECLFFGQVNQTLLFLNPMGLLVVFRDLDNPFVQIIGPILRNCAS
jgi:hypothetical protein